MVAFALITSIIGVPPWPPNSFKSAHSDFVFFKVLRGLEPFSSLFFPILCLHFTCAHLSHPTPNPSCLPSCSSCLSFPLCPSPCHSLFSFPSPAFWIYKLFKYSAKVYIRINWASVLNASCRSSWCVAIIIQHM